ncbi:MAG: hypothetical protein U9N84_07275, partial [Actinomycetota bacterium]|nr:hypothetical protein [Actinomycetota bacterium]
MREESGGVVATWSAAGTPLDSTDEAIQEERWTQVVSGLRRAADVVDPLYGAITFLFGLPAGRDELADPSFNDGITTWFLSNRLSPNRDLFDAVVSAGGLVEQLESGILVTSLRNWSDISRHDDSRHDEWLTSRARIHQLARDAVLAGI